MRVRWCTRCRLSAVFSMACRSAIPDLRRRRVPTVHFARRVLCPRWRAMRVTATEAHNHALKFFNGLRFAFSFREVCS
jgi:hypothetical protein